MTTKILIVDDHPMVREGMAARIAAQPDMEVCGEAADADQALEQIEQDRPDLVIVDISLRGSNGIDLIKQIKARDGEIKMLVSSMYDESLYAERALRAGALGYINKQEMPEKLIDAIRQVLTGNRYLSPEMIDRMVSHAVGGRRVDSGSPVERLSDRELEVFRLIGQGITTRAIANQLHLSVHTIDSHREKIKSKLSLKNSTELSRHAVQWVMENG